MPTNPTHEIDILHQRQRAEPAEFIIQAARDEQTLIAIGQPERWGSYRYPELDNPCLPGGVIKPKFEVTRAVGCGDEVRRDRFVPPGAKPGVGVEEQQPVSARRLSARGLLRTPPARRGYDAHPRTVGNIHAVVGRPAIDDNYFVGMVERSQAWLQAGGSVEHRDDDRQHRFSLSSLRLRARKSARNGDG